MALSWLSQSYLTNMVGSKELIRLTDHSANPSAIDTDVLDQAMGIAEAEVSGALYDAYPDQVTAGTASDRVTYFAAVLALATLSIGRPGSSRAWDLEAEQTRSTMRAINAGDQVILAWESAAGVSIEQGKQEFQADGDLYDPAYDQYLVPSEHDDDEV